MMNKIDPTGNYNDPISMERAVTESIQALSEVMDCAIEINLFDISKRSVIVQATSVLNIGGNNPEYLVHQVKGVSKLHPGDKFDVNTGVKMATGRALEALSKRLLKQAHGQVEAAEHNRVHSENAKKEVELHQLKRSKAKTFAQDVLSY